MNIVLIGFMGTGKSAVGKQLARHLGMSYIDTDDLIQEKEARSIPEIFAKQGENYFRDRETEVVKEVAEQDGQVISTGGGVVLREENMRALRKRGFIVSLNARLEVILRRTDNGEKRPLLGGCPEKSRRVKDLLRQRNSLYRRADLIVDTSSLQISEITGKIMKYLPKEKLQVRLGDRSYPVFIGLSLTGVGEITKNIHTGKKILIVSDRKVFPLYGEEVEKSLRGEGFDVSSVQIPRGERYKSLPRARKIYDICLEEKLDRSSCILALGGGVVGDLAGFVAATFLRGINFLMVPTTLLSQVDSGVGGKVGVNLPRGKNLIGAFYQPRFVLIDPSVLRTLSPRRIREGMAEVIKSAIIKDDGFFFYLEENMEKALQCEPEVMSAIIKKAVKVKIEVVQKDEKEEKGVRQLLNFGHTIGHAIEKVSKYGKYTHGEAVAIGMRGAAKIGVKMGCFPSRSLTRLEKLLGEVGLPAKAKGLNPEDIIEALSLDKKVREGKIAFVLPERIGQVFLTTDVPHRLLEETIKELVE